MPRCSAVAYAEIGADRAAPSDIARETLGADGGALPCDVFWLAAVALFAGVRAAAGDPRCWTLVDELLAPCADHVVVFGVGGAVLGTGHHWLGVVDGARGRPDQALEHFAEAASISQRMNAPYWVAEAMVGRARCCAPAGERRTRARSRTSSQRRAALRNGAATAACSPQPEALD